MICTVQGIQKYAEQEKIEFHCYITLILSGQ